MTEWLRNSPWRQGHLLESAVAQELGLVHSDGSDRTLVVVISQDCDIAQDPNAEPMIETVIGRVIGDDVEKGNNTNAKNARKLYISFEQEGGLVWGEFLATAKTVVDKLTLNKFAPRQGIHLTSENMTILQTWLASRYRRSAFPDEFEARLKGAGLDKKISKIAKPHGELILGVLFDVDSGEDTEHNGADDPYTLDIMILHRADPDFVMAEAAAIDVRDKIKAAFEARFKVGHQWHSIELCSCEEASESVASFQRVRQLKKWNLDSLSLGADPQQPLVE